MTEPERRRLARTRPPGSGAVAALLIAVGGVSPGHALDLASGGRARAPVVLARGADPAESTAAAELVHYLEAATSASFELVPERDTTPDGPAILVGPTAEARRCGPDPAHLGPEEWVIRVSGDRLLLFGGRPRGTLYAVYRFLEDVVGVRWWTPWEESVPSLDRLRVRKLRLRGEPAFEYRDLFGLGGSFVFRARNRLNGQFSGVPRAYGGSVRYGPPRHAHTFYDYAPPERYFDEHPGWYSGVGGLRYAEGGQLCLTDPDLPDLVRRRLVEFIGQAREAASRDGEAPPRLFSFSQNDWRGFCSCARCQAAGAEAGGPAGLLVRFVNRLADSIRDDYPEILLDTLAYQDTLEPPRGVTPRENVVVRFSALHQRDFSRPLSAATNDGVRQALEGWSRIAPHLRVWDYAVRYGTPGDLPLPTLQVMSRDLRLYRRLGVEGVFVQHEDPFASDMHALKAWVLMKLLEDPRRDRIVLEREFLRGYYGRAAQPLWAYRRALERHRAARGSVIGFAAAADDYDHLDAEFLLAAQRLWDRAEGRVEGDETLSRRVRFARVALDRATLWRWNAAFRHGSGEANRAADRQLDRAAVLRRYRETRLEQIALRVSPGSRGAARRELERELDQLSPGESAGP